MLPCYNFFFGNIISRKIKRHNESLNFSSVEQSILDELIKTLDSSLACEIREFWIDPSAFTVENFLGKGIKLIIFALSFPIGWCCIYSTLENVLDSLSSGHFSTVWSGHFQETKCKTTNVAVKKLKG